MEPLPTVSVSRPPVLVRAAIFLLVPVLLILTLPIILLLVIVLYLLAFLQGGRMFVTVIAGKPEQPHHDMQPPHFLELPAAAKSLPDDSTPNTQN